MSITFKKLFRSNYFPDSKHDKNIKYIVLRTRYTHRIIENTNDGYIENFVDSINNSYDITLKLLGISNDPVGSKTQDDSVFSLDSKYDTILEYINTSVKENTSGCLFIECENIDSCMFYHMFHVELTNHLIDYCNPGYIFYTKEYSDILFVDLDSESG